MGDKRDKPLVVCNGACFDGGCEWLCHGLGIHQKSKRCSTHECTYTGLTVRCVSMCSKDGRAALERVGDKGAR